MGENEVTAEEQAHELKEETAGPLPGELREKVHKKVAALGDASLRSIFFDLLYGSADNPEHPEHPDYGKKKE